MPNASGVLGRSTARNDDDDAAAGAPMVADCTGAIVGAETGAGAAAGGGAVTGAAAGGGVRAERAAVAGLPANGPVWLHTPPPWSAMPFVVPVNDPPPLANWLTSMRCNGSSWPKYAGS